MYKQNNNYPTRKNFAGVTFSKCVDIPVSNIKRQHQKSQTRKVTINKQHIADLAAHIEGNGLNNPIVVSENANGYIFLESGHHRLACHEELKIDTIPAYIATFRDDIARLDFLQKENDHEPVLVTTQEDAVKSLQLYKESGYFDNLNDEEQKRKAMSFLSTHYKHFGNRKKGSIYESFLRSEGKIQIIKHTKVSRTGYAEAEGYYAKSGDFDLEKKCWVVNATTIDNAKQMLGNINMWKPQPENDKSSGVVLFLTTGKKNKNDIKTSMASFIKEVKEGYNPTAKILDKGTEIVEVNFIPEIVGEDKVVTFGFVK
tara:strand:+ start:2581 stop:3522 length:942 start_codon:yes stop_codon:yes gene_type:complete